jgi:hypothetical protein
MAFPCSRANVGFWNLLLGDTPLTRCILPSRCDAEPGALADYILALLKHNVSEPEMRKELLIQLDEFLEKGAKNLTIVSSKLTAIWTVRMPTLCRYIIHCTSDKIIFTLRDRTRTFEAR